MFGRKKTKANVVERADALRAVSARVTGTITATMPSAAEIAQTVRAVVCRPDPWVGTAERAALTAVAARMYACNAALLGLLGGEDGLILINDELSAGLAERGFPFELRGIP